MINFDEAISIIRRNGGFKPNRKDTSYYRTYTVEGNRPVPADMSSAGNEYQDLDKIGCARQFESELSLHSLALFL